jgi:hypothetical protein
LVSWQEHRLARLHEERRRRINSFVTTLVADQGQGGEASEALLDAALAGEGEQRRGAKGRRVVQVMEERAHEARARRQALKDRSDHATCRAQQELV